jgi:hypothetical protein
MKGMFLRVLISVMIFFLFSSVVFASENDGLREWTILFYTCTDNNLETYTFRDFAKATCSKPVKDNITVAFMLATQNMGYWSATIEGNPYEAGAVSLIRLEKQDMADMSLLTGFIRQTVTRYPAKHYALFYQGHASGWYLHIEEEKYVSAAEMAEAVRLSGVDFEIIGFDACLMSSIETAYEFRNLTEYIIAFEDYGPWEGIVDPSLLENFSNNDDIFTILDILAEGFITRNSEGEELDPADISVLSTEDVEALTSFLLRYQEKLQSVEFLFNVIYAIDQSQLEPYYNLQDLYSIARAAFFDDSALWSEFLTLFQSVVIDYRQNQLKKDLPYSEFHYGLSIAVNGLYDEWDVAGTYGELSFPLRLETKNDR